MTKTITLTRFDDRFPHVLIYSTALAVMSLAVVGMISRLI